MIRLIGYEFGKLVKRGDVMASLAVLGTLGPMAYMGHGPQGGI